jgi:ribosomal protein L24
MIDYENSSWKRSWVEKLIFAGLRIITVKVASLSLQAEEFNIAFEIVAKIDAKNVAIINNCKMHSDVEKHRSKIKISW